jgi:hypothetical protein
MRSKSSRPNIPQRSPPPNPPLPPTQLHFQHPRLPPQLPLQPIIINIEIQFPHPGFFAVVALYRAEAFPGAEGEAAVLACAVEGAG